MHKHHGTLRLLIQMLAVILVGAAAYVLLVYGLSRHAETSTATTTPVASVPTATSSPIMASSSPVTTASSTASTTPNWEKGMQIVTNSDNNATVYLAKNERFVIQLGDGLKWSLIFDPATGITRVPNSTTTDGIQGMYEADEVGTTTLRGTGAPICKAGQACPMFLAALTITFVVK